MGKEELIGYLENVKTAYEARLERFKKSTDCYDVKGEYFFQLGQIDSIRDVISDLKGDFDLIKWINEED